MIPIDREKMTIIAIIACIAGVIFLFKELNKAKQDVDELKVFSAHMSTIFLSPRVVLLKQTKLRKCLQRKNRRNKHIALL